MRKPEVNIPHAADTAPVTETNGLLGNNHYYVGIGYADLEIQVVMRKFSLTREQAINYLDNPASFIL